MEIRTILAPEFATAELERGKHHHLNLQIPGWTDLDLAVQVIRGASPGKTLLLIASVHGDEYEGVRAILDLCRELDPEQMTGDVIAVPVVNPPAFWSGTRTSPLDGANLARVFPGDPSGAATQALAWWIDQRLIAQADLLADLHSAGVRYLMPTLAGYWEQDPAAAEAAFAFGAPVVWTHPDVAPGRTISAASARGIPAIYTEARGAGRIHPDDLAIYSRGCRNLLRHLHILPGAPDAPAPQMHLYGNGDIDQSISAIERGFLISEVELLQRVDRGQYLGAVIDLHGRRLQTVEAPCSGRVVLMHPFPVVHPGEPLFLVCGEAGGV